ncbi:MAG TPA: cbb3-type cytochrome c oxidase subunit I [Actinomycetota bacterium]
MKKREQMKARVDALREQLLEPLLSRFPRILPTAPDSAARYALFSALMWFAIWILIAATTAIKLVFPEFIDQFGFMSYGRMRQAETNVLNWGVLFMGAVGAAFAIVPRVCQVRLWSERIGAQIVIGLNQVVLAGTVLVFLGRTQGISGMEWPWPVDIALVAIMVGVLQVLMATVMRRGEERLNAPARHLIAAFHVLPITYAVANFSTPFFYGVKQTYFSGLAAAGFLLAMSLVGVGSSLFVLPRATGNPIFSDRLSTFGWGLMLFILPWLGLTQRILGPAQDWVETLGITFAIAALIPASFVVTNVIATARGGGGKDPAVKFMVGATVIWGLALAQLLAGSFRHTAAIVGATWWNESIRTAFLGAFGLWLVGLMYHLIPRIRGRALRAPAMVNLHFWIGTVGVVIAWLSLALAGVVQGYLLRVGAETGGEVAVGEGWLRISAAVQPMLVGRLAAGVFVFTGIVLLLYNVQRTLAEGSEIEPEPVVAPREPAAVGGRT